MSWQTLIRPMIRVLINDIDSSKYSNNTIDELSFMAASLVIHEINFTTTYTINYNTNTISPDPGSNQDFLNFVVLKAACLKNNWDFNTKISLEGVKAKLGPADIKVDGVGSNALIALLNEGPCKFYEDNKTKYNSSGGKGGGNFRAILSPFSHEDLNT